MDANLTDGPGTYSPLDEKPSDEALERAAFLAAITEYRFDVSVWDLSNGDIIRRERDLTPNELAEIEEEFEDEPFASVVIDDERSFERRATEVLAEVFA